MKERGIPGHAKSVRLARVNRVRAAEARCWRVLMNTVQQPGYLLKGNLMQLVAMINKLDQDEVGKEFAS